MNAITGGTRKMDSIEKTGHSLIQHGKENDRIYLMKYNALDRDTILERLDRLAGENGYSKIFAKVPASEKILFIQNGYEQEAYIPGFFDGKEAVSFMAKYFDPGRKVIDGKGLQYLARLLSEPGSNSEEKLPPGYRIGIAGLDDSEEMARLYSEVFKTYPFPIMDAAYLRETMNEGLVIYFTVRDQGQLVGLSSAELDAANKNAEMTDFAVLPACRGTKPCGIFAKEDGNRNEEATFQNVIYNSPFKQSGDE